MQHGPGGRAKLGLLLCSIGLVAATLNGCTSGGSSDSEPISQIPEGFDVQGHRGARGLRPENTLPAFEAALDLGVTTLELDLHFTADGQPTVWHDPVIQADKCGLNDGAPAAVPDPDDPATHEHRAIARLTVEQLGWFECDRNPDVGAYPDQKAEASELAGYDYRVVSLAELIEFVQSYAESDLKTAAQRENAERVGFNVETKRRPDDPATIGDGFDGVNAGPFELALLDLVGRFELDDRVTVQSFDPRSLRAVHAVDPNIGLAALTFTSTDLDDLVADGVEVWSPRASNLTAQQITDAHDIGLEVIPWTVNDPVEMDELILLGVDGIITDRPDLLLESIDQP
ncbi:MAG: glycerophosphodiester phosphodiesterase family protein [Acidimicrobiales bacterium]